MFEKWQIELNPMQKAIIAGNADEVFHLKETEWRFELDKNGFTPLELSKLLGQKNCEKILLDTEPVQIRVQLEGQKHSSGMDLNEFENLFNITYRSFLTFSSYDLLQEVINNCPYLLKYGWLSDENEKDLSYKGELFTGYFAPVYIKWIDSILEYGLFAATDLPQGTLVGEYTGCVRRLYRTHSDANVYCFHYPTRFCSFKYFAVDAMLQGNYSRFINHSSTPNLQPRWLLDRGLLHLVFIANRQIAKGTELTFDYGPDYWIRRKKITGENASKKHSVASP